MHPLLELQRLLTPGRSQVGGKVIAVSGDKVTVATSKGVKIATRRDITDYRSGDRVFLQGNELVGKATDESTLPVFFI